MILFLFPGLRNPFLSGIILRARNIFICPEYFHLDPQRQFFMYTAVFCVRFFLDTNGSPYIK